MAQDGIGNERVTVAEGEVEPRRRIVRREPGIDVDMGVVTPVDRIRWGPVLAGVFTVLGTLIILSLLGLAIGLSTFEPGDPLSNFGLGASIWGIASAILAFIVGGALAAYAAAVAGRGNGALNGMMVWLVTLALIIFLLGSGIGGLFSVAATGAQTAAPLLSDNIDAVTVQDAAGAAGIDLTNEQADLFLNNLDNQNVAQAAETSASATWVTLLVLLLGLASAVLGGALGARPDAQATVRMAGT